MAMRYQILYWRDIPAQVKAKAGRRRLGRPLSPRFQAAIDEAAMRAGKAGADEYLAEWRAGDWVESEEKPEEIVDAVVEGLEAEYSSVRLKSLIGRGGWEAGQE